MVEEFLIAHPLVKILGKICEVVEEKFLFPKTIKRREEM